MQLHTEVVEQYRDFIGYTAGSPCFRDWADGVVGDPEVLAWIGTLPAIKQQPNLVFAAARWHGVAAPGPYSGLRDALLADRGDLRRTILGRATQTNEVGRLATLMPVLSQIALHAGRPLALLEVGASAGLCLYPDRWDHHWPPVGALLGSGGRQLSCAVTGDMPVPATPVEVSWRGGIDLNPLDVTDDDAMAWLATLVWPEQHDRRALLTAAIDVARADPPFLVAGDLLDELPALVEVASTFGEVVVFHSAVIAYLDQAERRRFRGLITELVGDGKCRWVSNEGKQVLPHITATGPDVPAELSTFVLGLDGRAVAWTHGHGASITWL